MESAQNPKPVRILDDIVVNQIAAGEVVERPSSVAKELIENALDAKSTEIVVSVEAGGRSSIIVRDNGHGMSKDDALLAIERFGTSKISSTEELKGISTLGFRGEAIPSIASVSKFTLTTRAADAKSATQIRIDGGKLKDVSEVSAPVGTQISVKGLFFNVPARRKFLKTERTELGYIKALISDIACAHPEIRFSLVVDGVESISYQRDKTFDERIKQVLKGSKSLVSLNDELVAESGNYKVKGLIGAPLQAVSSAGKLRVIVNGRCVRDKLMLRAIRDGYGNFLKPGKYPVGVVSLSLPAEDVDINVHPQKSEVRFRNTDSVFKVLARATKRSLSDELPAFKAQVEGATSYSGYQGQGFAQPSDSQMGEALLPKESNFQFQWDTGSRPEQGQHPVRWEGETISSSPKQLLTSMRYLGQIFKCYLLFEGEGVFSILDMHAAHERIRFVKIRESLVNGKLTRQQLLAPELVNIPSDKVDAYERQKELLSKLGLDTELYGEDCIKVSSVPAILSGASAAKLIEDLFALPDFFDLGEKVEAKLDEIIASMACHSSIRSGRELEKEEAYALVSELDTVENSAFCPHGRPVVQHFTKEELEVRFGRIQ